ncbi:thioredoxin reductase [Liquorilactobacillus ghanensis DSM 18630]|uniref:Ferredoxin--NADP reductase n=2 Tax=Liquorilactobacillus ghanensis TaxID=399370 RepID=A0A0R1VSU1_9LACO|nr:thioredoxin reductase [Liquorilactobacillus ghanensis DSM 18630]
MKGVTLMSDKYYDITIIGGGPVGVFAAAYAKMRQAKVQVIESLDQLGGQVAALFPAKKIYDIPGYPVITGTDLVKNLVDQAEQFNPEFYLAETVQQIHQENKFFKLITSKRTTFTKAIIIATGVGAFQPRRLNLPEASQFENNQLRYFIKDPNEFSGKDLIIAGGGDSAVDWALDLMPKAKSLHIVHRRNKFRALESNVAKLKETDAVIETPFLIDKITPSDQQRIKVTLKEVRGTQQKEIEADYLLVNYGIVSNNKYLKNWNLAVQHGLISVNSEMETAIPGIYAIGDVTNYNGKLNLIAAGFGEAPIAVNNALLELYPDRRQPMHSTQLVKALPKSEHFN